MKTRYLIPSSAAVALALSGCVHKTIVETPSNPAPTVVVEHDQTPTAPVVVHQPPPPPEQETPPPPPSPDQTWIAGHWEYRDGAYTWVAGHYEARPSANAVWTPGHWDQRDGGYVWIPGRWST